MKGVEQGLRFELRWFENRLGGTAADCTRGELYIELGGQTVWGNKQSGRGIEWTWVDLLEHLTKSWAAILWEEADPMGNVSSPWRMRWVAERGWSGVPKRLSDLEQRMLLRFERSHNLAFALGGASVPSLWLLREGTAVLLVGADRTLRRPFPEVIATLEALGNEIAIRLRALRDPRALISFDAWRQRNRISLARIISFSSGLPLASISEIQKEGTVEAVWGLSEQSPQPTAELAAARMFGRQAPAQVIRSGLEWIRTCEKVSTPDLDALSVRSERLVGEIATTESRAFQQGYALAGWLREIPGLTEAQGRVEPEKMLNALGVRIEERDLEWADVDAVACWGAFHGPAVLVNSSGKHAQGAEGRRTTLAHELCHLLADRCQSLPLAEVLGGRAPVHSEQRANAFAAELLLPREFAGKALTQALTLPNVRRQVSTLRSRFGVSSEVIAWQALRSNYRLSKLTIEYLGELVSDQVKWNIALRYRLRRVGPVTRRTRRGTGQPRRE